MIHVGWKRFPVSRTYTYAIMQRRVVWFWLSFVALVWLTHALGYLVHEPGHTIMAWAAGYKANPAALDYGSLSVRNVLLLSEIDEGVNYDPILAAGKGWVAAMIAAAGVLLGSGGFYLVSRLIYAFARTRGRRMLGLFAFLLCLMNTGNFLDYVPVRTFATHGDMARIQQGLHISPWWIVVVLGVPFAAAIAHFFVKLLPDARSFLFPDQVAGQVVLVAVSAFSMFVFFGSAGIVGYGEPSHWISMASILVLFPAVLLLCLPWGKSARTHSAS